MPSLARSTVYNAVGSIAMLGSGFLSTVIAARLLGPEAFGVIAYATMLVGLTLAVLDLGLPGAMTRFLPELPSHDSNARAVAASIFVPYAALSVLAVILLFLLLPHFAFRTGRQDLLVSALVAGSVLVQSLAAFHYGVLKGRQEFAQFAALAITAGVVQVILAWLGARSFGITGALAAPLVAFAIPAAAALRGLRIARPRGEIVLLKRLLSYSAQTWLIYVLTTITWSRLEVYFLRQAWGDHAAGLFAAGLNLANVALQAPMFLTGALLPYLVARGAEDPRSIAPAFRAAATYFSLIVIPACFGGAAIAPALLACIYGDGFRDSGSATALLILGNATMAVFAIVQIFAFATGRTWPLLVWTGCTATLTVISGLTLIANYGVLGAAAGRVGVQIATLVAMLILVRAWGWSFPWLATAKILAAAALMSIVAHFVTGQVAGVAGLALAIVAGAGLYVLLCVALRVIDVGAVLARRRTPQSVPISGSA